MFSWKTYLRNIETGPVNTTVLDKNIVNIKPNLNNFLLQFFSLVVLVGQLIWLYRVSNSYIPFKYGYANLLLALK